MHLVKRQVKRGYWTIERHVKFHKNTGIASGAKQSPRGRGDCFVGKTALLAMTEKRILNNPLSRENGLGELRCGFGWGLFLLAAGFPPFNANRHD